MSQMAQKCFPVACIAPFLRHCEHETGVSGNKVAVSAIWVS